MESHVYRHNLGGGGGEKGALSFVTAAHEVHQKVYTIENMLKLSSSSPIQTIPQPCRQSTKLRNMNISIETKVLIKFGASDVRCVELRAKNYRKCTLLRTC